MATLPGLPMFGHGQVEGFTEKYGMEYQRPRYEERPDHWLVERHEREIAPLLKRRWLFAESTNFLLYDFFQRLRLRRRKRLRLLQSQRRRARPGCLQQSLRHHPRHHRISAAYADKGSGQLRQQSLWEGLGLQRSRLHRRLARLAHRPRIPAPRPRRRRPGPHPQSPCLSVPRLPRLARTPRHRREVLGPPLRPPRRPRRPQS